MCQEKCKCRCRRHNCTAPEKKDFFRSPPHAIAPAIVFHTFISKKESIRVIFFLSAPNCRTIRKRRGVLFWFPRNRKNCPSSFLPLPSDWQVISGGGRRKNFYCSSSRFPTHEGRKKCETFLFVRAASQFGSNWGRGINNFSRENEASRRSKKFFSEPDRKPVFVWGGERKGFWR